MNAIRDWLRESSLGLVIVDADDTVWFDHRYFRRLSGVLAGIAQKTGGKMPDLKTLLKESDTYDETPESIFARVVEAAALELIADDTTLKREIDSEIAAFKAHPIELLPGAIDTIRRLSGISRVVMLTKGNGDLQRQKLQRSAVSDFLSDFICVDQKNTANLAAIMNRLSAKPENTIYTGNSVRHDVVPATELGIRTIWLNHSENVFGRNMPVPRQNTTTSQLL